MFDTLIKLIPLVQGYPMWLQMIVATWIVISAVVIALLFITPKTPTEDQSNFPTSPAPTIEPKPLVNQQTTGDNSPTVAGVEGNVTIIVEGQKNAK